MKFSFENDAERSDWEALDDAELVRRVRDGFRASRDSMPGNVASSKEIMDDPGEFKGKPAGPERPGATVAAHDSLASIPGYARIGQNRDGRTRVVDDDHIVQSPKRAW